MEKKEHIKGGLADNMSLSDIAKKHDQKGYYHEDDLVDSLKKQLIKGIKVEMEHTKDKNIAREIAMDHLYEDPNYYDKLKKIEANEMDSGASGSFDAPAFGKTILKRDLFKTKEQEIDEVTAGVDGSYDVPLFGGTKGRKNPLSIGGEKTIMQSRAVKDKNFPKYGGPEAKFVGINPKCKKFPYCNQGQKDAIKLFEKELEESVSESAKKYGVPIKEIRDLVIKEITQIFI